MKPIKLIFWAVLVGLPVLWLAANSTPPRPLTDLNLFRLLVQVSGTLAIGVMSLAMILATRSTWLEQRLNGLDKAYRLHKWLGIAALVTAFSHWVLMRVAESRGHDESLIGQSVWPVEPESMGSVQGLFHRLHDLGGSLGNYAFYPMVLLVIVALIRRIPYRFFASTHTLLAVLYLFAAGHSVLLLEFRNWSQPVGIITALLILGGVVSAVMVLMRQVGRRNRTKGRINSVRRFPEVRVISSHITLEEGWQGHRAGQFAFVTYDRKEGKHPFTIASAWDPATREIMIVTRGLGDYTDMLPEHLEVGGEVAVEGPYGCFTFDDDKDRQIWVAGGIGITPFIAKMKERAMTPDGRRIDLFCAGATRQEEVGELLRQDAEAANVTLHFFVSDEGDKLTGETLREVVPDWQEASVWFCGPGAFGDAISRDLVSHGLSPKDFHRELFNMR